MFSDPEVMRWNDFTHKQSSESQEYIDALVESPRNGVTDFVICLRPGALAGRRASSRLVPATPIGTIGLSGHANSNDLGFTLDRSYWRHGLATEALTAMLDYLFGLKCTGKRPYTRKGANAHVTLSKKERESEWMYPSISADVEPRNEASIGLLEKLGFVQTGERKKTAHTDEGWQDSVFFRLEREKWMKREAARDVG